MSELYYNSDKHLTNHQEEFLKKITELCAEYRILIDGHKNGINFLELDEENCCQKPFYTNVDIMYHGDCVEKVHIILYYLLPQ